MIGGSIQQRLTGILQIFALLIIVTFAASALLLTGRALRLDETELLKSAARRVADSLDNELTEEGSIARAAASFLAEEPPSPVTITILAPDGSRLGSTRTHPGARESDDGADEDDEAAQEHMETVRARCGAIIQAAIVPTVREEVTARLVRILLLIALPLTLLALLLARWTIARALRPLSDMAQQASAAIPASGQPDLREDHGLREVDELARAFNRLLESLDDHLQAEQRFTAEASHELRTPLTVLSGEIELALTVPGVPEAARECLVRAAGEAGQMHQLTEALLLLRKSAGNPTEPPPGFESVNLADILRDARDTLLARFPDRVADVSCAPPDELVVRGEPALLASAVKNLLDNALKFTQPGDSVRVALCADAGRVRMMVEDGGAGIPPDEAQRLFEPFYRGRRARASTAGFGLGLPVVRRVLRAHGGDISCFSSDLGGAGFELWLPLWAPAQRPQPDLNSGTSART